MAAKIKYLGTLIIRRSYSSEWTKLLFSHDTTSLRHISEQDHSDIIIMGFLVAIMNRLGIILVLGLRCARSLNIVERCAFGS